MSRVGGRPFSTKKIFEQKRFSNRVLSPDSEYGSQFETPKFSYMVVQGDFRAFSYHYQI